MPELAIARENTIPPHVPGEHVVDFDYMHPAGLAEGEDIYHAYKRLHDAPDILWSVRHGGHWIVTRYEDVRWVQSAHEYFSESVFTIPRELTLSRMPPVTSDPPDHAKFRAILNPFFVPSKIARLADDARDLTHALIAGFKPRGQCEFVTEFAQILPVEMFLRIVDLPAARRADFVEWGRGYMSAEDEQSKAHHYGLVVDYLTEILDERGRNPGGDLMSRIAAFRKHPRYTDEEDVIGMALGLFFAGLDSVANALSFAVRHLAEHPELRQRLIRDPAIIPRAAEEFIRRFALACTARIVRRDVEYKGIRLLKDELILVAGPLSGLDERVYRDPFTVDFDRTEIFDAHGAPRHTSFSTGIHTCVGAPLARAELRIFLELWLREIPDFRLDPGRPASTHGGGVVGIDHLHLLWNT